MKALLCVLLIAAALFVLLRLVPPQVSKMVEEHVDEGGQMPFSIFMFWTCFLSTSILVLLGVALNALVLL